MYVCIPRSLTERRVSIELLDPGGECDIICALGEGGSSFSEIDWVVFGSRGLGTPGESEEVGSVDRVRLSRKGGGRDKERDA